MRDFVVGFEGWLEVEAAGLGTAVGEATAVLANQFQPLVAVGGSVEWDTGFTNKVDFDKYVVDFAGNFTIKAENEDLAFSLGFALMNAFVSPTCHNGVSGDWEIREVEEAGASKVPA